MDTSCLTNVIGLSQRDCSCLPDKLDDWEAKNKSLSGYYLDNYEYMISLNSSIWNDCENPNNIWASMEKARTDAIEDLVTRLLLSIGDYHTPVFGNVQAEVGNSKNANGPLTAAVDDFIGLKITPHHIGATLTIRRLDIRMDVAKTYTVKLYSEDGTELESQDIVSTGSFAKAEKEITWQYRFKDLKPVYITVDRSAGEMPQNSEIYCPTCGGSRPFYYHYLSVDGFQTGSLNNLEYATTSYNSYNFGIFADFTYQCDYLSWMCDRYDDFWKDNSFGRLFAKVLQMLGSQKINEKILNSSSVSYWTLVGEKEIIKMQDRIAKLVNEIVPVLAMRLPNDFSDCFSCRSYNNMKRKDYIIT